MQKASGRVRGGRFHGAERIVEHRQKRMLEDRGALPKEDGDLLREYQAMHEENFLSSWLREDMEREEEERKRLNEEAGRGRKQQWEKRGGGTKGKG